MCVSDGAPHLLRVRGAHRRPLPAGGGRRRVAHGVPALLRVCSAARPPPFLLPARPPGLLQAGLCQVSLSWEPSLASVKASPPMLSTFFYYYHFDLDEFELSVVGLTY